MFDHVTSDLRLLSAHRLGRAVQMHTGCDGVERGFPAGQLHALLLPAV